MLLWVLCIVGSGAVTGVVGHNDALDGKEFDYVVVGGGVSGLTVANRLSENRRHTVLVIERGDFDDKPEASIPYYASFVDYNVTIRPLSAPNPMLHNQQSPVTTAAVVGGGSVVSGMAFGRGSRGDYAAWEELGNPGWNWDTLLPYFKKSATFTPPSPETVRRWNMTWDPSVYGKGPVQISLFDYQYPDVAAHWDALRHEPGVTFPPGANDGSPPGAVWNPVTVDTRSQTRSTARSAYYDPVKSRPNLRLVTRQRATKILFGHNKPLAATGVRIVSAVDGKLRNVYAKKEVILCAGAVMTPPLLQASGIGPADVLKEAEVHIKKNLPAVGANFQDHPTVIFSLRLSNQTFPNPDSLASNATFFALAWAEYYANRTGPITQVNGNTVAFYSLPLTASPAIAADRASRLLAQKALRYLPDVYHRSPEMLKGFLAQRALLAKQFRANATAITVQPLTGNGGSPSALLKPLSRGSITLNVTDRDGLPIIQYNTLVNPIDAENIVSIIRMKRKYWASPALAYLHPVETVPGAQFQTDQEILQILTTNQSSFRPSLAQACGTCAMMPEELGGCVGPDLRVHGIEGLSIADASIIPLILGTSLMPTVYAIAERAADLIKARA